MGKLEYYEAFQITAETIKEICSHDDKCYKPCIHLSQIVNNKITEAEKKKDG